VSVKIGSVLARLGDFVVGAAPPPAARDRAAGAFLDTIGVTLAGSREPAAQIVQRVIAADGPGERSVPATVLGTPLHAGAADAALANGTAAHALDYDDMCFVSLAHPSAPLVSAALAAGEGSGASGRALVDAYIVGFEIEARLGVVMNPRHYRRGWHCTSTLGTIGAAAAASRLSGLTAAQTVHALAIAASEASGLKENFGTMVKPLHAGLAARNGVLAASLAQAGLTASEQAIDGSQGFLAAFDSERSDFAEAIGDLGARWEICESGITVKLYPSCAGTHPTLDVLLELKRGAGFTADDVDAIEVGVDAITPTVLIYERPSTGLEAKFSMPFCAAAAVVDGRVDLETFDGDRLTDPRLAAMMARVSMRVDPSLDASRPALTQARVTLRLRDGRVLARSADGARGYPDKPASDAELRDKFLACAARAIVRPQAEQALRLLTELDDITDVRTLTRSLCALA